MEIRRHEGGALTNLCIEPDGYTPDRPYPLVILLHGYGSHMGDLAGLCQTIDRRSYLYALPNAPIPVQIGPGAVGYAWTGPPGGGGVGVDDSALEGLVAFFEDVTDRYSVEPGRVVLGGFSQGGMMTYLWGLPNPDLFTGLVVLSSKVPDSDVLEKRLPADRTQPLFIAHGTADSMISVQDARESRDFLEAQGYTPEYREYDMGHQITEDVLADVVPWIHRVLGSGGEPG